MGKIQEFPLEITLEEARNLLQRAIDEKGADYVYRPPIYNVNDVYQPQATQADLDDETLFESDHAYFADFGVPSCLIGHVLHYKGVSFGDLLELGFNTDTPAESLFNEDGVVVLKGTEAVSQYLQNAQSYQDMSTPWGEAMAMAEERLAEGYKGD